MFPEAHPRRGRLLRSPGRSVRCHCRLVWLPVLRRIRGRIVLWARVSLGNIPAWPNSLHDRNTCRDLTEREQHEVDAALRRLVEATP